VIQEKVCRGTGKAKGFDSCGQKVPQVVNGKANRVYGLGRSCGCFQKWLLSTEEGSEVLNKAKIVGKKKVEKEVRKKSKEEKEKLIDYRKKLQTEIQKISRLIDIGLPCLARGYHADQIHGGHIFSRGSNSTMALNLHAIHRQSAQSNHFQNEDGLLKEGLVKEYGQEYFDFISELRRTPQIKYSNIEYKEFYRTACSISNMLKKKGARYELKERIEMRNEINKTLGIYSEEFCVFNE
jgi:hypothetical protein